MAVIKKPDGNNKNQEAGNKETGKKGLVLRKEKREPVKKDTGRKDAAVKKEKADRIDQARKFFRGALNELKKVHWPARREVVIYTSVVLVAVVAVGLLIWLFDSVLSLLLKLVIVR
ncbi:MAG: preprotein translocase subunit SecE [Firmicutes bacterium]|nr:preprotein translocase subunit SecE [Bacillota bacterium]